MIDAGPAGIFTGALFLRFAAPPDEINQFLRNSPSISKVHPKIYSRNHVRIEMPKDFYKQQPLLDPQKYEFISQPAGAPDWFTTELWDKGRVYDIPGTGSHLYF